MRGVAWLLLAALGGLQGRSDPHRADPQRANPRDLLAATREALGGDRWNQIAAVRTTGIGYTNALEQSERPEGPWIKTFEQFTELRDLRAPRVRRTVQSRSAVWGADWSPPLVRIADTASAVWERGGRQVPGRIADLEAAAEGMLLAPERIVATAAAASDLQQLPDTTVAGVRNHRLAFTFRNRRAELLLDVNTALPSGYLLRGPSPAGFDRVWGDVTRAVWYSLWSFDPPGLRYPRMVVEELNGQPLREMSITAVAFLHEPPADSLAIADSLRPAFLAMNAMAPSPATARLGRSWQGDSLPAIEPAPGIVVLPGLWYTSIVRHQTGVTILEAPIGPEYSAQVLAEAAKRYPGMPVTGVVTTSDAWPHLAGIREYVARDVPIHHLDLNRRILERLVRAPWRTEPDSLERRRQAAKSPVSVRWEAVGRRTVIGEGPNRMEIIPARGEGAERMLLVWFPEHRLLYASDLLQPQPQGGFFWPEYVLEVTEIARREELEPRTVWAMHADPMPWSEVVAAVERVRGSDRSP
ncbi:MAG TPA: hypothetical protein VF178_01875 [Gemmatimonadaceae bacterium]